jgi:dTDP-4-dehydrorhamnose reductase
MLMAHTTIQILLTGASGYLGQHLLDYWSKLGPETPETTYKITALFHTSLNFAQAIKDYPSRHSNVQIIPRACNLIDYGQDDGSDDFNIVIHAAAMSSPRVCENEPDTAYALNAPLKFLRATKDIPMIALSTDQVYDGKQSVEHNNISTYYQEDIATTNPLNVYSKTKIQLEQSLQEIRSSGPTTILRSSIIIGPKAPISPQDTHDTFLHFCASRQNQETRLWGNEYRTVVSVVHVCRVIDFMVKSMTISNCLKRYEIYNLGGSLRVNRFDMAMAVFQHFGFDSSCLKQTKQTSPTVPLDISMDSTKLFNKTKIEHEPSTLRGLTAYTFPKC